MEEYPVTKEPAHYVSTNIKYKLMVSKEERSLKESHAGRITRNKVFF